MKYLLYSESGKTDFTSFLHYFSGQRMIQKKELLKMYLHIYLEKKYECDSTSTNFQIFAQQKKNQIDQKKN